MAAPLPKSRRASAKRCGKRGKKQKPGAETSLASPQVRPREFQRLIEEQVIHAVQRERGKLRAFLCGSIRRMLSDHLRHEKAQKRGGGQPSLSFDEMDAEERYAREPRDTQDSEVNFTRAWAGELIAGVREQLRAGYTAAGGETEFALLQDFIQWDREPPAHTRIAESLDITGAAVRVMVHRPPANSATSSRKKWAAPSPPTANALNFQVFQAGAL